MKQTSISPLNISKKSILLVGGGVIAGAVAGTAVFVAYSLLTGKSMAGFLAAKTTLGLHGAGTGAGVNAASAIDSSSALNMVLPASLGVLGGGASGLGIANKQLSKVTDTLKTETDGFRQQLQVLEDRFTHISDEKSYTVELERIKGIGPKFSHLLQKSGIDTIDDLAKTDSETLDKILRSSLGEQFASSDDWIKQAQSMSKQSS